MQCERRAPVFKLLRHVATWLSCCSLLRFNIINIIDILLVIKESNAKTFLLVLSSHSQRQKKENGHSIQVRKLIKFFSAGG